MLVRPQTPEIYLLIIRSFSLLVPKHFRLEWRREWDAEIVSRWAHLKKWERVNALTKLDLLKRVAGAFSDVLCFQQRRASFLFAVLNMLVALLIGFGAIQHFIFDGFFKRHPQSLLLSLAAMIVSILFFTSGIALLRRWRRVRWLIILTGTLSILVHVYGTLPPHRTMGFPLLLVGAGYGLFMIAGREWSERRTLAS